MKIWAYKKEHYLSQDFERSIRSRSEPRTEIEGRYSREGCLHNFHANIQKRKPMFSGITNLLTITAHQKEDEVVEPTSTPYFIIIITVCYILHEQHVNNIF